MLRTITEPPDLKKSPIYTSLAWKKEKKENKIKTFRITEITEISLAVSNQQFITDVSGDTARYRLFF